MATRKKTAKKAAKKSTARKTAKKAAPKKASAPAVKRIAGSATVRTKSQITNSIVDATGMTRKEVNTVFEALESLAVADLKKGTDVKFMGIVAGSPCQDMSSCNNNANNSTKNNS